MVQAKEIAEMFGKTLNGDNVEITCVATMQEPKNNSVVFAKYLNEAFITKVNEIKDIFVIASEDYITAGLECAYITAENPRLTYLRVINKYFYSVPAPYIHPSAIIEESVRLGKNVSVGAYSVLSGNVTVSDNTVILNHVTISGDVTIGKNCLIKSGAVIGEEGFGFEPNEKGELEHFPHIGRIIIGDNVFLGANSTIERAALDVTMICDGAKIDDLTQVGHNVTIGKNTWVAVGAALCGGVVIGENCNIAPNSSVRQKLTVGNNSVIGLGAVVVKNVPDDKVYAGNPAKELKKK